MIKDKFPDILDESHLMYALLFAYTEEILMQLSTMTQVGVREMIVVYLDKNRRHIQAFHKRQLGTVEKFLENVIETCMNERGVAINYVQMGSSKGRTGIFVANQYLAKTSLSKEKLMEEIKIGGYGEYAKPRRYRGGVSGRGIFIFEDAIENDQLEIIKDALNDPATGTGPTVSNEGGQCDQEATDEPSQSILNDPQSATEDSQGDEETHKEVQKGTMKRRGQRKRKVVCCP
ncbi:unnamed protein product [Owenia fusiformis]|uniref:Uncharacterized protein n=1 Tax=Owenia fusiformis TaxID=6347 RepID=A0A8J1TMS8_OWEFU|nr:unnamed protein product [Owenia fusiformis]